MSSAFDAKSVAVIGASRESGKLGNVILKNFATKFKGKVYPINPNAGKIFGLKSYASILEIHGQIDLAVIVVPAKIVPKVLEECGKKKIKDVVIISSGFAEIGNNALEEIVKNIIKEYGMRVIGVNCIGIYDPRTNIDTLFLPPEKLQRPKPGGIGLISQSGAVGSAALDLGAAQGLGFSKFISYGNATGLDEVDLLEMLAQDDETKVILLYIEGVRRGREFFEMAKKVTKQKPVVVLKAGRTSFGSQAAMSHTGSLAGSAEVFDAVIKQTGMIAAKSLDELFDYARVFATQPLPKGKRVLVITNGGGAGVLAADSVSENGLQMAQLSESMKKKLKAELPGYAAIHNPLDLVGDADSKRYELALDLAIVEKEVDSIACLVLYQTSSLQSDINNVLLKAASKAKNAGKPFIVVSIGGDYSEKQRKSLESRGIPAFDEINRAIGALAKLSGRI